MNTRELYRGAVTPTSNSEELKESQLKEEQRVAQLKHDEAISHDSWLKEEETSKVRASLIERRLALLEQAIDLSATFHSHNNHLQIISLLQRAHEIGHQLTTTYARRTPSNNPNSNA